MSNTHINPDGLFQIPGLSQVVTSSRGGTTIHIAGQGALDKNMKLVGEGDYRAQAKKAFENLAIALAAVGATPADVVSSVMYVRGMDGSAASEFIAGMNEALDGQPFPANASSLIGVQALALDGMLVEISAVAVIN
jgi:enamine deaminase RidA (YjgF/YER057c/UK114 family)